MVKTYTLRACVLLSLIGVPLMGPTQLYGLADLWFGVPLDRLWEPFWVLSIPVIMLGPSMHLAEKSAGGVLVLLMKRKLAVAMFFLWSILVLESHYAAKFGVVDAEAAVPMYVMSTIGSGLGYWGAYHVRRKLDSF